MDRVKNVREKLHNFGLLLSAADPGSAGPGQPANAVARLYGPRPHLHPAAAVWRLVHAARMRGGDCEGAEHDIIQRLTPEAAAQVGQMAVEVHRVPGYSVESVPARLGALGFEVQMTAPLTAFRPTRTGLAP